ncbi:SDR family oxidoreductase [Kineococcus sp. SYSU DK002]|uniref:SDR family oxidoreductase n=1 Tax=Kineococcus sp. SYSU DK002 TaxID=3383123 RepID=UPI003D7E151C
MKIAVAGGTGTVGRHVVVAAAARGHATVVLSRSRGVDLRHGAGLAAALAGTDVVVDVTGCSTQRAGRAREFSRAVTTQLLRAGREAGVGHHVVLSVVGADRAPHGYYAGKALQEELVRAGGVPWTVLRTTQFHEFARQVLGRVRLGPLSVVPVMRTQPVAAREVAERLVDLVEGPPAGPARDLAGPQELRLVDAVRAYARATGHRGPVLAVPLPGGFGRALRDGTLLPAGEADRGRQTFAQWLAAEGVG